MRKVPSKNIQWLQKELPLLEQEGVLSHEKVQQINSYYTENTTSGASWAITAFSILGSLLIGSGIILLFAHNWDELSRFTRAILSFCPLVLGIILSSFALKNISSIGLREAAGIFHSLAVGTAIALIGQTYHIRSDTTSFLLTWALLIAPLFFLLRSVGAYLIYLVLISCWAGIAQSVFSHAMGYWLLVIPAIIYTIRMMITNRYSNGALLTLWGTMFALCFALGMTLERTLPGLWTIIYATYLSSLGLLGIHLYRNRSGWNNPPLLFSVISMGILIYIFTWTSVWNEIGWDHRRTNYYYRPWGVWTDPIIFITIVSGWAILVVKNIRNLSLDKITLVIFPILTSICFLIGSGSTEETLNALIFNGFMLFLGIIYIVQGCKEARLRKLNGGMALLSLLLITRFFDADFGFMARGIAFIILGACFLTANLVIMRQRKKKEVSA